MTSAVSNPTDFAYKAFKISRPDPRILAIASSGITASIALKVNGVEWESKMDNPPKTGVVTAAAGGTGQVLQNF